MSRTPNATPTWHEYYAKNRHRPDSSRDIYLEWHALSFPELHVTVSPSRRKLPLYWTLTSWDGEWNSTTSGAVCPRCECWLFGLVSERWRQEICYVHCWKCGMKYYFSQKV